MAQPHDVPDAADNMRQLQLNGGKTVSAQALAEAVSKLSYCANALHNIFEDGHEYSRMVLRTATEPSHAKSAASYFTDPAIKHALQQGIQKAQSEHQSEQ